jgi:hypothetical protein
MYNHSKLRLLNLLTMKIKKALLIGLNICLSFFIAAPAFAQLPDPKLFLVCGDSKVLLVDYNKSKDSSPEVIWSWDAHFAQDLPEIYRTRLFNTIDDCKAIENGEKLLVSSSSGAVAILSIPDSKVLFYAAVPNAHSIAMLPDNRIVAAASVHKEGNKIILFDAAVPNKPLFTDSLYSAHGVVWNEKRNSLFVLGYDVLREYQMISKNGLRLKMQWKIPGEGGHELHATADGQNLFVTEHHGAWLFDVATYQFKKIDKFPDAENIKSLGQDPAGQYIYTVPEENWWTYHVSFFNPARKFAFPDIHVYKARWFLRK